MSRSFELFWSFRSPYCYLALDRLLDIHRAYDVEIHVRPIYPIAVRDAGFFKRTNPKYRPYHLLDSERVAKHLGIPYRRPRPDPIVMDMKTNAIADEQPYIYRLTRLGAAATIAGNGLAFVDRVSRLLWDGTVDGWDRGDRLKKALAEIGLDLDALDRSIAANPAPYEDVIQENQRAHDAAGHWGVPLMVFEGEPFFGQDRIELLLWRMKQKGLENRVSLDR